MRCGNHIQFAEMKATPEAGRLEAGRAPALVLQVLAQSLDALPALCTNKYQTGCQSALCTASTAGRTAPDGEDIRHAFSRHGVLLSRGIHVSHCYLYGIARTQG